MGAGCVRSVAWLFDLSKHSDEADDKSCTDSGYNSQSESDEISEKESSIHLDKEATISYEELNTGIEITASSNDDQPSSLTYPGAWPVDPLEEQLMDVEKRRSSNELQHRQAKAKKGTNKIDPTLDSTTLLIAKLVPFKFNLKVRDQTRAQHVRELFNEGLNKGEYKEGKGYWGKNHGKNKELGWGKV